MELKIIKTYNNPNTASSYKMTKNGSIPINTYHAEDYEFTIGSIILGVCSFRNNKLAHFNINIADKRSEDGSHIYFALVNKSFEEIKAIIIKWLNE